MADVCCVMADVSGCLGRSRDGCCGRRSGGDCWRLRKVRVGSMGLWSVGKGLWVVLWFLFDRGRGWAGLACFVAFRSMAC